jgi:hypothetical protein
MCLKIIQKILHNPTLSLDPHNLIKLLIDCLEAMSQNINKLSKSDKEIYYQEIKKLVRHIHSNHKQQLIEYNEQKRI